MRLHSILSAFILSVGLAACGGSGSGDDVVTVDARTIDGSGGGGDGGGGTIDAPGGGVNALGQVCSMTMACPAGNSCTTLQGLGSQTMGYCTPMCSGQMSTECATGYTGPASGRPVCALSTMMGAPPSACAIICTAPADCPAGLACTPVPGQMASICVVPA